jgi:hypothetical protein
VVEIIIDPAERPKLQFMEIASRRRPRTGLLATRSNAAGDTIWTLHVSERERAEPDQRHCPRCGGLGLENFAQCSVCDGKGVVHSAR